MCLKEVFCGRTYYTTIVEAEFLDVILTKVFLHAIHSHLYRTNGFYSPPPPFSKSGLKLVCHINFVYGNLKSENSQDYARNPQRNCTFMNSASGPGSTLL
jgi:hypothetical protein